MLIEDVCDRGATSLEKEIFSSYSDTGIQTYDMNPISYPSNGGRPCFRNQAPIPLFKETSRKSIQQLPAYWNPTNTSSL